MGTSVCRIEVGLVLLFLLAVALVAASSDLPKNLEPFIYKEDFESRELNAWASYPLWQDTAFDPNFRVGKMVPGDANISIIQRVTPYSLIDNYAGAQKKLDILLAPESSISLRFYIKTQLKAEFFKIRIPTSADGIIDFTIADPATNAWERVRIPCAALIEQNPRLNGKIIRANGLAVLAKIPNADPDMPVYLGLDDIVVSGARTPDFRFLEPTVDKLSEWKPHIPRHQYRKGESLRLRGEWPVEADNVALRIAAFTAPEKTTLSANLKRSGSEWSLSPLRLGWPEGLYLGELSAFKGKEKIAATEFTIFIAPSGLRGKHPRLWFDSEELEAIKARLKGERFRSVAAKLARSAKDAREKLPLGAVIYDVDAFPKDEPLLGNVPRSIYPWFERIRPWRAGLHENSLAFALLEDKEAGDYAKALLVKLSLFPAWLHPWFESRGQHIYYPVGELAMDAALAYDLVYDLMTDEERKASCDALRRNVVLGCHRSYAEDNLITSNTSNWIAHITGGSAMSQAAIYGDGGEDEDAEPYLTAVLLKMHEFIRKSSGRDGGYGESYGYCSFTMESLAKALPALENVFRVDFSGTLDRTYADFAWTGLIKEKLYFHFGDSGGRLGPMTNWAFVLARNRDPLLGWLYHFLKQDETLADVIYRTEEAPRKDPFARNPVRVFRDTGTTVFRSGWEKDDFVFVLRSGAFFNHQHLDQGTFWLADRGRVFISERQGSTYYDDPIYQSHYTQPVAHSTILLDRSAQSQRVGDPLLFIEGLDDHAFIHHFLDGRQASFVSGDIGRLYWGKVKEMRRNVLYLKPRAVLMLDAIVPSSPDVEVTLLYQTSALKDIQPDRGVSRLNKDKVTLQIHHLWPEQVEVKAEETPLYINSLKTENPLTKEGMLAVTARTEGKPLVMAQLLTTAAAGEITKEEAADRGCVSGKIEGRPFVFSTGPGRIYSSSGWTTDALALTWSGPEVLAALATTLDREGRPLLRSTEPITCEISDGSVRYCLAEPAEVSLFLEKKPRAVIIDGKGTKGFTFDSKERRLTIRLAAGEGEISFEFRD